MRLVGTLFILGIIAYISATQLRSISNDDTTPDEYIEKAKQSADSINEVIKQQQEMIDRAQ